MTPEEKAKQISDDFLVYGDESANARLEAAIAAALRESACPYVVQAAGGTAHCALAERDGQARAQIPPAVLDLLRWLANCCMLQQKKRHEAIALPSEECREFVAKEVAYRSRDAESDGVGRNRETAD